MTWANCLLRTAVLDSNLLEKGSIKLWLQLLIPILVDNVSDFLFPTDMRWTVGITLQSLSSTNVYYCLPHQKALKTEIRITVSKVPGELCSGDPFPEYSNSFTAIL